MQKKSNSINKWIWLSVFILFICVTVTTVALVDRMNGFLLDDSGAISLITETTSDMRNEIVSDGETQIVGNINNSQYTEKEEGTDTSGQVATAPPRQPGFETSDDKQVWITDTQVEIFRISYENGEKVITVKSDNDEKIIAPGTENSYTFKLKNTGNVALDYTVTVDVYLTPGDIKIPITGRINRYDGKWIVGNNEKYADVLSIDAAEDSAILGAGKYTYYTFDWFWPFESSNDGLDTMLGNLATEQDITFTIIISTTATESADPDNGSGITPPQTGDDTNLNIWIALAIGSFIMLLLLIFFKKRDENRCQTEEA